MMKPDRTVAASCPEWMEQAVDWSARYTTDESRMSLVIELARQNVLRGSGGPFGAAVFESASGGLVAAGVNSVTRLQNSMLHAEVLAIMLAESRVGSYTLLGPGLPQHELVTTCDPCAMCLGAVLWSGVRRLVTGADRADASALDFDEGPVFPESYAYLEARGVAIVRGVLRREAAAVMELYRRQGGVIYNA
jgi:tRNA(Arg) A34 adenosine deaminase TadA